MAIKQTKSNADKPALSIVMPTRDRADYLQAALRTCLLSEREDYEVLVLDNASVDGTQDIVASFSDNRVRYERSEIRLSMRDNFERALDHVRGEIVGFIGDDDGIFDFTPGTVLGLFERHRVDAVAAARAHYGWPDLQSQRRNTGLLPRGTNISLRQSRHELRGLLRHSDYYRLPCIYHGFVKTSILQRLRTRHRRLFLSSQVDIFSAIALSMEDMPFAFCESPLVINGGSSRSNGASHFGGGSNVEKVNWKKEDDLGFLPGFADHATVGSLIVESAIRYCQHNSNMCLHDLFPVEDIRLALRLERAKRIEVGKPLTDFDQAWAAASIKDAPVEPASGSQSLDRLKHLSRAFSAMRAIDMRARGVHDVLRASQLFSGELAKGSTGYLSSPLEQVKMAMRLAFGRGH